MNEIKIFNNPYFGEIRTATTENNDPLFCLVDLCKILGLQTNKVRLRIDQKGCLTIPSLTNGGMQDIIFVCVSSWLQSIK